MGKFVWLLKAGIIVGLSVGIFGSAAYFSYELFVKPYQVPEEKPGVPLPTPEDPSLPELEKAMALVKGGELVKARSALEAFLLRYPFSTRIDDAKAALGEANVKIFFSSTPSPEKIRYVVKSGDALIKIERKLNVSRELLMRCNNLTDPRRLSIGQVLYVNPAEFSIVINRAKQTLVLLNKNRLFKEYKAIGWEVPQPRKGGPQPLIQTTVRNKVAWHDGGRVAFGSKEYDDSHRWVELGQRNYTLYGEGGPKPPGGILFSRADMEELSTLLSKNVPVSIQ